MIINQQQKLGETINFAMIQLLSKIYVDFINLNYNVYRVKINQKCKKFYILLTVISRFDPFMMVQVSIPSPKIIPVYIIDSEYFWKKTCFIFQFMKHDEITIK